MLCWLYCWLRMYSWWFTLLLNIQMDISFKDNAVIFFMVQTQHYIIITQHASLLKIVWVLIESASLRPRHTHSHNIYCYLSIFLFLYWLSIMPPGGEGTLIFSTYVGSGPASTVHPPKNIRNFKHPQKIFEILATPKNIPNSVPWP